MIDMMLWSLNQLLQVSSLAVAMFISYHLDFASG